MEAIQFIKMDEITQVEYEGEEVIEENMTEEIASEDVSQ